MKKIFGFLILGLPVFGREECIPAPLLDQLVKVENPELLLQYGLALRSQFADLVALCETAKVMDEISHTAIASVNIRSFSDLNETILVTRKFFSAFQNFRFLLNSDSGHVIIRLLGVLSTVLRRGEAGSWSEFKSGCTVSHRYKSSAILAIEENFSQLLRKNTIYPISSRLRDLSISNSRCLEDSFVSVVSVLRSFRQGGLEDSGEIENYLFVLLVERIGFVRALGVKQPLLWALESLSVVRNRIPIGNYEYIDERKKGRKSTAPVFGFDCAVNGDCEVKRVISAIAAANVDTINQSLRREHLFLQSINANWFPILKQERYGLSLTQSLAELGARIAPRSSVVKCANQELERVVSHVAGESTGSVLAAGLRAVIDTDEDCTIALAAAFSLVQEAIARTFDEKSNQEIFEIDFAGLMEMAWQTIAGDKLDVILSNPLKLFDLMSVTWSRIV